MGTVRTRARLRASDTNTNSTRHRGAKVGFSIVLVGAVIAVTGCTGATPQVTDPTRMVQAVNVGLASNAQVQSISDSTVLIGADGNTSATSKDYSSEDALGNLPVRVSVEYRTDEAVGTDLADLKGYSGRVEIALNVENLTVSPQSVTYDLAGESRTDPALVGSPLTVAASTQLDDVLASQILTSASDGPATNGVLSTSDQGKTIVQWATLLAPPMSPASSQFTFVADVKDFKVPSFTLAVQPGISTDMSTNGVIASNFGSDSASELALQRRTIGLLSDVNSVLAKAGSIITEVRTNLETTSNTLGVSTAEQLKTNTESLSGTMSGLGQQLSSLKSDLDSTVEGSQSVALTQLQQTVATMSSLLGDTTMTPPQLTVDGQGCAAVYDAEDKSNTVYGNLLRMSAQLGGYAQSGVDCRDKVIASLVQTVGPKDPSPETCQVESLTCSLYGSAAAVTAELAGLLKDGDDIINNLQPEVITIAKDRFDKLVAGIEEVRKELTELKGDTSKSDVEKAMQSLKDNISITRQNFDTLRSQTGAIEEQVSAVNGIAQGARSELTESRWLSGPSMIEQNQRVADAICELQGEISDWDVERLRSYLSETSCGTDSNGGLLGSILGGILPRIGSDPMDVRLKGQVGAWDQVIGLTDLNNPESGLSVAISDLNGAIDAAQADFDALDQSRKDLEQSLNSSGVIVSGGIKSLSGVVDQIETSSAKLGEQLDKVNANQSELETRIREAFTSSTKEMSDTVRTLVNDQIRTISAQSKQSAEDVTDAFNRSINGLKSTAATVKSEAKDTVDGQQAELKASEDKAGKAVEEQTQRALAGIAQSTSASTRDVEGAAALLRSSLNRVMLDLGDRKVDGSGLLGSMATSAAKADTADYQLALASQNAAGYANIREQDVAGILLKQAQLKASLQAEGALPAFMAEIPEGVQSRTVYTFQLEGAK